MLYANPLTKSVPNHKIKCLFNIFFAELSIYSISKQ